MPLLYIFSFKILIVIITVILQVELQVAELTLKVSCL